MTSLALLRQALQKPIQLPLLTTYDEPFGNVGAKSRELARQLALESDVRFADGDYVGAMESKLDAFDLATRYEQGALVNALTGNAIAGIGRKDFEKVGAKLDRAQSGRAIARLKAIQSRQVSFADVLKQEQVQTQQMWTNSLPTLQKANLSPEEREQAGLSQDTVAEVAALTPAQLRSDVVQLFAPAIRNASLAYPRQTTLALPENTNPLLENTVATLAMPQMRFHFERSHAQDRLLLAALDLHAQKLATGDYPTRFSTPTDPFSPTAQPFVYKKTNGSYLLYSLGPDGKDDNGGGFEQYVAKPSPPPKRDNKEMLGFGGAVPNPVLWVELLPPGFQGDIVQTPF